MSLILRPPADPASLQSYLSALGRSRKRAYIVADVLLLLAIPIGILAAICGLDSQVDAPPLLRGFSLLCALILAGLFYVRLTAISLRIPSHPLHVALLLEKRIPALNDALASAVDFLDRHEHSSSTNSPRFRAVAVRKAERLEGRYDFHRLIPTRRLVLSALGAVASLAAVAAVCVWNPARASTAFVRLADPFGTHAWPAATRIELLEPSAFPLRLTKNDPLDLRFIVSGLIPDHARIEVRFTDGGDFDTMHALRDGQDRAEMSFVPVSMRLDADRLTRDFSFRITANDADTGWRSVAIVPPPRLVSLNGRPSPQMHMTPPDYTRQQPSDLPDGLGVVEIPTGSTLRFRAAVDMTLASAHLTYLGDRSAVRQAASVAHAGSILWPAAIGARELSQQLGADIALGLTTDGREMSATFMPNLPGMYALRMTDATGLTGSRLLEIRLTADPSPAVALIRPAISRDSPYLTPAASLSIEVSAVDKLYGLKRTFIEYRVGADEQLRTIAVDGGSASGLAAVVGSPLASRLSPLTRIEARRIIRVREFFHVDGSPVRDGDRIRIQAAADDWDDISVLKQPGRSAEEFEVRVISPEGLEALLQQQLAALRPELIRMRDLQRDARRKAADLRPDTSGRLSPQDRDRLLSIEQAQRQLAGKVGDPREGLHARAELLQETIRANALPRSATTERASTIADGLDRLANRDLVAIVPLLAEARDTTGARNSTELLARADRFQKNAESTLDNLLDILNEWGGAGEIRGEARSLKEALDGQTRAASALTDTIPTGRNPASLSQDQTKELERSSGKFDRLAENTAQLMARADNIAAEKEKQAIAARSLAAQKEQQAKDLRAIDPDRASASASEADGLNRVADKNAGEADALREAIRIGGGQSLADEVRKAGDATRANRSGEAIPAAKSASQKLGKLIQSLGEKVDRAIPDAEHKKTADTADELAAAQDALRKRTDAADRKMSDPDERREKFQKLAREQGDLLDKTRELARSLARNREADLAREVRNAADRLEVARDDLERAMPPLAAQAEAVEKLDETRDRLDALTRKPERQPAPEKQETLADRIRLLAARHKAEVQEVARLNNRLLTERKWNRAMLTAFTDLEERERALSVELRTFGAREFPQLPVFDHLLASAANGLERAADGTSDRVKEAADAPPESSFDADREKANATSVDRSLTLTTRRIDQLLAALASPSSPQKPAATDEPSSPVEPPPAETKPNPHADSQEGQLKALRALQAELNERTAAFALAHPDISKLDSKSRDELKEIEQAQNDIAALFQQMAKRMREKKEKSKP